MNSHTPRIFIAATGQNTGKTTTSLGLYSYLSRSIGRIGYIKPIGQRFHKVDGKQIDKDSILIQSTYLTETHIEDMSPIAVEPDFTRQYINQSNQDALVGRIQLAFDRCCWQKEFAIIEGSGHAGVGSVFDLSNAKVAKVLNSKVLLVASGGIGRPIDEVAINKALFDREGVEVVGVVMNKVHESKIEYISDFAGRGFKRLGLELLGVLPLQKMLTEPTMAQVAETIKGTFYCNQQNSSTLAMNVVIGAMSSANLLKNLLPGTLLIVPGDREDIVLAAISQAELGDKCLISGLILSDGLKPHPTLLAMIEKTTLPVVFSERESYAIAQRIHSLTIKIEPNDTEKIKRIQGLIAKHVDIPRLLEKIGVQNYKLL